MSIATTHGDLVQGQVCTCGARVGPTMISDALSQDVKEVTVHNCPRLNDLSSGEDEYVRGIYIYLSLAG